MLSPNLKPDDIHPESKILSIVLYHLLKTYNTLTGILSLLRDFFRCHEKLYVKVEPKEPIFFSLNLE